MRYWHTNLTVAVFLLLCGMSAGIVGCTKAPTPKDSDIKFDKVAKVEKPAAPKEISATSPAVTAPAAKEPEAKEPTTKETPQPAANDLAAKEPAAKDFDVKEPVAKDLDAKEPATFVAQDTPKKDKTKDKSKDKSKDKESPKDTSKEPKFEFKEPSEVGGKTFAEWLKLMENVDPLIREDAMKNVTAFGPNKSPEALPKIIFQMNRHKSIPIDLSMRVNGIIAMTAILQQMGMAKKEPSEKLLKDTFEVYKFCLKDGQVIMKVRALQGLPWLGPISHDAIENVILLCKDPVTWEVRKEALQTLTRIAKDPQGELHPKVMPELRLAIKDSAYLVRQTAVQAITFVNTPKVPPELFKALGEEKSVQVRLTILNCIASLSPAMEADDRPLVVKKLEAHLLVEPDPILNMWTHATIMTTSKSISKKHLDPVITRLNESKDPSVRVQALAVISLGGEKAKVVCLKDVLAAIHDPDQNVAVAAMMCSVQLRATEAIPILEKIESGKKAPEYLKAAAAKALDAFDELKAMAEDKAKKDKDNKTPDKK
jgi:HEAT repeat protein